MALILLAGCGEKPEPTIVDNANGTGIVFAYEAGNHLHAYGGRVFADGRYELFSTERPGQAPQWEAFAPFTAAQVDQIAAKVDAAMDLPAEIKGSAPPDAARATFTLRDRSVVVDEYPKAAPRELEAILDTIAQLRKKPPVPSTWKVWDGTRAVTLEVPCEVGEVEVLASLRDAIFMPEAPPATDPKTPDPPQGTPLVALSYASGDRFEISADDADQARVKAVRAALAQTDWAKLPSRLC